MTQTSHTTSIVFGMMIAAIASSSVLAADQPPNLKGKWIGKTYTIVAGMGGHWPTNKGTFDKPGLLEKDLVIEVTGQEDRRFWGVQTLSGNGETTREPMIGELTGADNRTVIIVDTDGYLKWASAQGRYAVLLLHAGWRQKRDECHQLHRGEKSAVKPSRPITQEPNSGRRDRARRVRAASQQHHHGLAVQDHPQRRQHRSPRDPEPDRDPGGEGLARLLVKVQPYPLPGVKRTVAAKSLDFGE